jgi:hypothetical protein
MECMLPVTCLPRKPFFRSLTHAELNIHTISSVFRPRFLRMDSPLSSIRYEL